MERYITTIFCILSGLFFLIIGGIGLRNNHKVSRNSAYKIVEGIGGFSYFPGRGNSPYVIFKYNGEEIFRYLATSNIKMGEKIRVYYNPDSNDMFLRVVGKIDNKLCIICMLPALVCFGAAFIFAFPELFI